MSLSRKNILILNNQGLDEGGGGVTITQAFIDYFSRQNSVTFLCRGPEDSSFSHENLTIRRFKIDRVSHLPFLWRFSPLFTSFSLRKTLCGHVHGYDLVLALDCKYALALWKYCRHSLKVYVSLSTIPIVGAREFEGNAVQRALIFLQYWLMERYAFERSDLSFVSSQRHLRDVKKYEWIRQQPHVVYPYLRKKTGVLPDNSLKQQLKRDHGLEGKYLIVTVARITRLKNLEYLTELAERISRDDVRFLVIGDGPHASEIQKLVHEKQLQETILFYGEHEDPNPFYQMADIYLHPSLYESFGCVIYEAMMAGLPVIFPKNVPPYVSAFEELIRQDDALCVDFTKHDLVLQAIEQLLDDPTLCEKIGRNAHARAISLNGQFPVYARAIERHIENLQSNI